MELLVGVHVQGDWNPGIDAAQISLYDKLIQNIQELAKRARPGEIISAFESSPNLGTSDLDLENQQVIVLEELSEEESQQAVFGELMDEGRSEICELHVDKTDFWWSGVFKHTDVHWETRIIPLSILPRVASKATTPADLLTNQEIGDIANLCTKFCGDAQILIVCLKEKEKDNTAIINRIRRDLEDTYKRICERK